MHSGSARPSRLAVRSAELANAGRHGEAIAEMKKALAINPRGERLMDWIGEIRPEINIILNS